MISEPGRVVVVPFPFVDLPVAKVRPALVLSSRKFNTNEQQTVLAMITTAAGSQWRSDYEIVDWAAAGLRTTCVVRMKLFTLENRLIQRGVGQLTSDDWHGVRQVLTRMLPA